MIHRFMFSFLVVATELAIGQTLFTTKGTISTGNGPQFVAVGDFNRDGILDLAVANTPDKTVTILSGDGTGGFSPMSVMQTGFIPYSLAVGDFNNDGAPDLAVVTDGDLRIFLGNGTGGFIASGSPYVTGISPFAAAVRDFNRSGNVDIALTDAGSNAVAVLLGSGQGGFAESSTSPISTGRGPQGVAVGDFNGDGRADLAIANFSDDTVTVLLGDGVGGFVQSNGSPFPAGEGPTWVSISDFNGDGLQDLLVSNYCPPAPGCTSSTVLLGDGRGGFSPSSQPLTFGGGSLVLMSVAADFNGDGKPDVATVFPSGLAVLLGNGDGTFRVPTGTNVFAAGTNPYALAIGDFNKDGNLDVAVVNQGSNSLTVFLGTQPTFPPPGLLSPAAGATNVQLPPLLSWNSSKGAVSYDVYFGSTSSPGFAANTTGTTYSPPPLALSTTYYWRVVARNGLNSATSLTRSFTTQPTSASRNGADIGVFRSGQWWLDADGDFSFNGSPDRMFWIGEAGDVPILGDWDNTGVRRVGVFRNGLWFLDIDNDGVWDPVHDIAFSFGQAGDVPIVGDWDGSGIQRIGVFRAGQWWLDMNGDHQWDAVHDVVFSYGQAGDTPLVGDWDNTGLQRIGVFRGGQWWLDMNGDRVWDPLSDLEFSYGEAGDTPVIGDWTHSGVVRVGVFRKAQWWLDMNNDHVWNPVQDIAPFFGLASDLPVVAQ